MKLASYKNASRDGQLVVVNKTLTQCVLVTEIASTMQQALDDWAQTSPKLESVYQQLNASKLTDTLPFDSKKCESPLPRAYQWADGSAYVNHVELVRKARGAEIPESFWNDPLMYQGGSDDFIGPTDDVPLPSDKWGIDFEAEVAIVTDDVPMGTLPENAGQHIKLIMLVNDVSLRGLIPGELAKGFGFFQSKPASAFSPVAVTPDELADKWVDNKVHLPLISEYNHELFGCPQAGVDMTFDFSQLVAHAAKSRNLSAGTIIGSGTVSNKQGTEYGTSIAEGGVGYSCIAEVRMIETIRDGEPSTEFMKFGDHIKIEMKDEHGNNIFGSIEQQIVEAELC
ncbi:fumarylacetoacetate hydrolase family protein [Alteromonas sp. M12]|uniref:fumarylacetoacetate hydrolase family protein n=1 Tax=Alteromonas sp. M12 TaxID=3135644 RepID=UPI00319EBC87